MEVLHGEIAKLEPAIKHVEMSLEVTKTVKEISDKHLTFMAEMGEDEKRHKEELRKTFIEEINVLMIEHKKILENSKEIQQKVKEELDMLVKLRETVQAFHDRVIKINFPERFENLESAIEGLPRHILNNMQNRLDQLEYNLNGSIRVNREFMEQSKKMLSESISSESDGIRSVIKISDKNRFIRDVVTWSMILITVFLIYIKEYI